MDSDPSFVYTTYIRTTPERLWQALTDPAFTRATGAPTFQTDWKPGSTMRWDQRGVTIADPEQVVLEAEPPSAALLHLAHLHARSWPSRST